MKPPYIFYTGNTPSGDRIRPSNWMYRLADWTSTFEHSRLVYNPALIPVIHNNIPCLRINKIALKHDFPELFDSIIQVIVSLEAASIAT